jgi:hypothetical protein
MSDRANPRKIKLKNVAHFSPLKNAVFLHHVYHAFHHVLTIKKPRPATTFFQNTPQKPQQKQQNPGSPRG